MEPVYGPVHVGDTVVAATAFEDGIIQRLNPETKAVNARR